MCSNWSNAPILVKNSPNTQLEFVSQQCMELWKVHFRSQYRSHLDNNQSMIRASRKRTYKFITCTGPLKDSPIWVDSFRDLSFATVASNSWSNFLADPVSWPSPSTQATWFDRHYDVGFYEQSLKLLSKFAGISISKLEQNLESVIVGEISWEVSNPGPNVEDALKLLTFSNAVNQPCNAWLSVLVSWMQIHLASLHISCCFLGFTCFLKTCRRPESSKHTTGWLFWQTWVTASCSTEKLRFKRPAIGEFQGSFCLLGFHGVLNISGRSTRHKTLCDVFWPTFPVWQEFFELLQVFDWLPWQAAGCDGLFQS